MTGDPEKTFTERTILTIHEKERIPGEPASLYDKITAGFTDSLHIIQSKIAKIANWLLGRP